MKLDVSLLQRYAPSQLLSLGISVVGVLLSVGLYIGIISVKDEKLDQLRADVSQLVEKQRRVTSTIRTLNKTKAHIATLESALARDEREGLLTPLLQSYAMRCKSYLDPIAKHTGLLISNYTELPLIALPLPKASSASQLYARQPILCQASGSYRQLLEFVRSVEEKYPLATLSGLTITPNVQDPEQHSVIMTIEWLVRSAQRQAPLQKKGKK